MILTGFLFVGVELTAGIRALVEKGRNMVALAAGAAALIGFLYISSFPTRAAQIYRMARDVPAVLNKPKSHDKWDIERQQHAAAQRAVKPGELILVRSSKPFLLNFSRNPLYVVDWPGGASPSPGLPFGSGVSGFRSYFIEHGIHYILYSYGDEAGHSRAKYGQRLHWKGGYLDHVRGRAKYAFDFQDKLMEMRKACNSIYDDGAIFVLDLTAECPKATRDESEPSFDPNSPL